MNLNQLFAAVPAALLGLGDCEANAGQTIEEAGALACVSDKWDESQPDEGHRLVNFAGRCILIPDDPTMAKSTEDCAGKYEYMPDGSWKGSGTCTWAFKGGDKIYETWEEGSHLKEYVCKFRGGTANTKASVAAVRTRARCQRTPSPAADTRARSNCTDVALDLCLGPEGDDAGHIGRQRINAN